MIKKKKKKNLEDAPKTSWSSGTFISNLKKSAQIRPTNSLYGMRLTFPEEKKSLEGCTFLLELSLLPSVENNSLL